MKKTAIADIKYNRIHLWFRYDAKKIALLRQVPGARANKGKNGDWYWSLPLDLQSGKEMSRIFGADLELSKRLRKWALQTRISEKRLSALSRAEHAKLERLPNVLPELYQRIYVGPRGRNMTPEQFNEALSLPHGSYQTADVAYMAASPSPLNANQPGLGKTYEAIGSIFEAGIEEGLHLVIAPKTAIEVVWGPTLRELQPYPVYEILGCYCDRQHKTTDTRIHRTTVIQQFLADPSPGKWLIVNPEMVRLTRAKKGPIILPNTKGDCRCTAKKDGEPRPVHFHYDFSYHDLQATKWATVINDECHKGNVRNHKTPTAKGIVKIRATEKTIDMSGTPMKTLGVDIWGILNHLHPQKYSDYWGFAQRFFEVSSNGHGSQIGKLRDDKRKEFYDFIASDILRRTKKECLTWLPDKQHVDEDVSMEGKQRTQYERMHEEGVFRLGHADQYSTSVLAELMRLTQFAIAYWEEKNGLFLPTTTSCKIERTMDILDEHGIFEKKCDEKVVIFSQFRTVLEMLVAHLHKNKVDADLLSGKMNKRGQRREFQQKFQNGSTRVACVVTTAGGVAIDLDRADTAIRLDESYAPDDDIQADDRLHRASRIHQVTIHTIRTKGTIDAARQSIKEEKHNEHITILDLRRQLLNESF